MSKVFTILAVACFVAAGGSGAATARAASAGTKGAKPPAAARVAAETKPPAEAQAPEEAPIVMGRSVAAPRKSKLHHIKVKPLQQSGTTASKN